MKLNNLSIKLTNRDLDVLAVFWDNNRAMTASEVVAANPALNKNTVQPVLRKLLKNDLIRVADIVYSGTVLSRSYLPTMTKREFSLQYLSSEYKKLEQDISKASFFSFLLDSEKGSEQFEEDLQELDELLQSYKNNKNSN
jgi:predicted transcriptional regulator